MQAVDCIGFTRTLLAETNSGQRWSDADMLTFTDRAQKLIVRELKWPPGRFTFSTVAKVQEYQLDEVIKILGVYLNGQIIERTDIATMEGRQIQLDDSTGTGGGPGGLVVTNQAPTLAGKSYTPAWSSEPAAAYPVASDTGYPSQSFQQPWMTGMRPRYYCEGGNIGFVPAPLSPYTVVARVVLQPPPLQNLTDVMVLPDIALDAVCWKACEYAYFSDRTDSSTDARNYAIQQFQDAMKALRAWRSGYDGDAPQGPKPVAYRAFSNRVGRNRIGA